MLKESVSKIFLISLICLTMCLNALEEVFDSQYATKIISYHTSIDPPSVLNGNLWVANSFIHFDNGLYGVHETSWKRESKAKKALEFHYSGNVNITPDQSRKGEFILVYEDGNYKMPVRLWLDRQYHFGRLTRVKSITENLESASGSSDKYRYVIELNDGVILTTKFQQLPWNAIWESGSQVIKIGNSKRICLINKDILLGKTSHVSEAHYLKDLECVN